MVQFNLLRDVKIQYIRATRIKYIITLSAIVSSVTALTIMSIMLFTVKVVQQKTITDLNKDISTYTTSLKSTKDLDRMLTVQNQLNTLTSLHEQKPAVSRVYKYVSYIPAQASLVHVTLDFTSSTLTLSGSAQSLDVINTYTNSLKGTTYTTETDKTGVKAYSDVVLSSFAKSDSATTFTITMKFDPVLFDITQNVTLHPGVGGTDTNNNVFRTKV